MVRRKVRPAKEAEKDVLQKRGGSDPQIYTKPVVREKIKKRVLAGQKGGRTGQWSARKAQLVTQQYEAAGGGYKRSRQPAQMSLKSWGDEQWRTLDSGRATQGRRTRRYLPDAAWKELTPDEQKATDRKKIAGSARGKQFVANTAAAKEARSHASRHSGSARKQRSERK
jgi:hypothetical protein